MCVPVLCVCVCACSAAYVHARQRLRPVTGDKEQVVHYCAAIKSSLIKHATVNQWRHFSVRSSNFCMYGDVSLATGL